MKIYPNCPRRTNSVLCVFTLDLAGRISSGPSAWDFGAIQESPREKQLLDGKAHKHLDWAGLPLFFLGAWLSFSMCMSEEVVYILIHLVSQQILIKHVLLYSALGPL